MDRNIFLTLTVRNVPVALRKESVDRNVNLRVVDGSKSSVALRKESVDRNSTYVTRLPRAQVSLSARRAWIEILGRRNKKLVSISRSPQGERG